MFNAEFQSGAGRDRVYTLLLDEILSGQLRPGARLVEQQLTDRFGWSRTPVREALFRLENEGFVRSEVRRGFRVAPLTEAEARQIYPIIGALEALAIGESGSLVATLLPGLFAANDRLQKAIDKPEQALAADAAFHEALTAACPNMELRSLLDRFHHRALRYEKLFMRGSSLVERSVAQHKAIIDAIADGRTKRAQEAVQTNYETGMESVISTLRMMASSWDDPRRRIAS